MYNGTTGVTTSAPRLPGVDPVIVLGGHSFVWEEVARRGDGVPAPVAAVSGGAALGPAVLAAARGGWAGAGSPEHLPILNIITFCALLSFNNIYKLSTLWHTCPLSFNLQCDVVSVNN